MSIPIDSEKDFDEIQHQFMIKNYQVKGQTGTCFNK